MFATREKRLIVLKLSNWNSSAKKNSNLISIKRCFWKFSVHIWMRFHIENNCTFNRKVLYFLTSIHSGVPWLCLSIIIRMYVHCFANVVAEAVCRCRCRRRHHYHDQICKQMRMNECCPSCQHIAANMCI